MKSDVTVLCGTGSRQSGRPPYFLVPRPSAVPQPVRRHHFSFGAVRIVASAPPGFRVRTDEACPPPSPLHLQTTSTNHAGATEAAPQAQLTSQRKGGWSLTSTVSPHPMPALSTMFSCLHGLMRDISRGTAPKMRLW